MKIKALETAWRTPYWSSLIGNDLQWGYSIFLGASKGVEQKSDNHAFPIKHNVDIRKKCVFPSLGEDEFTKHGGNVGGLSSFVAFI